MAAKRARAARDHVMFYPLLALTLIVWAVYRQLFTFPVWFDEVIGKAVFFGLPVWLYITTVQAKSIVKTFSDDKIKQGLLLGIAIGGLFGFAASLVGLLKTGGVVTTAYLFESEQFWGEFILSIFTGFWESLFFFGWIMTVILEKHAKWPLLNQVLLTAGIFLLFHIPNTLLRFSGVDVAAILFLLFMFALGQGLVFSRWKNLYAATVIHALWGLVLLFHF